MLARLYLLGVVVLLAGCQGTSVVLDKSYPRPLVKTIPLSLAVYYSEDFKTFRHVKKIKDRGTFVVELGASQVSLFDTLLTGTFSDIKQIESFPPIDPEPDASGIIVPEIVKFELSIPDYTQDKIYEVWINYRMRLYAPDGSFIMEWPLVAYGKTPVKFFKLKQSSLTRATHVALRDAGAQFILGLDQPQLRKWLSSQPVATRYPSRSGADPE